MRPNPSYLLGELALVSPTDKIDPGKHTGLAIVKHSDLREAPRYNADTMRDAGTLNCRVGICHSFAAVSSEGRKEGGARVPPYKVANFSSQPASQRASPARGRRTAF